MEVVPVERSPVRTEILGLDAAALVDDPVLGVIQVLGDEGGEREMIILVEQLGADLLDLFLASLDDKLVVLSIRHKRSIVFGC